MLNKKQKLIIAELRKDSRKKFSKIAEKLGMKKTTMHGIYQKTRNLIKANKTLLNFDMLGYTFRMNFIFRIKNKNILDYITKHKNIDRIQLIKKNKLMVWGIFQRTAEAYEFKEALESKGISNIQLSHVLKDIDQEMMFRNISDFNV